jgi:hypothetical protein
MLFISDRLFIRLSPSLYFSFVSLNQMNTLKYGIEFGEEHNTLKMKIFAKEQQLLLYNDTVLNSASLSLSLVSLSLHAVSVRVVSRALNERSPAYVHRG